MIQRIRKGWRTLRENKRAGVSLIVALCAVALIIGLALSLTYSSSLLLARANRKVGRERCYQLAKSFSEVLDGELRRYTTDYTPYANQSGYAPTDTFYRYANRVLDDDRYINYDPDDPDSVFRYATSGDKSDPYGQISVKLRKESTEAAQQPTDGSFNLDDAVSKTTQLENQTFIVYLFRVDVEDEQGSDSYTWSTEYYRSDSYQLEYQWCENGAESGSKVYWVNGAFCQDANGSQKMEKSAEDVAVTIRYHYNTDKITKKIYEPTYLKEEVTGDA